jgi:8-oxo-dGTP diphosphatase
MSESLIHVAVAVIEDDSGRVLLSQRPAHTHQGGLWEFPGGKVEAGEGLGQALCREIHEELGLEVTGHRPLIRLVHHYQDRSVLLDVHRITAFSGDAHGREGQAMAWVLPTELNHYPLLPADRPIVTALRLPERYLITGPDPANPEVFLARLRQALAAGVRLVQLRAKTLPDQALRALAGESLALCREYGARMLINGAPDLVEALGADGVHLTGRRLASLDRRPLDAGYLVGASCHSAQELSQAVRLGLDFAVLSPVLPTASHPEAQPLGWARFGELVEGVPLPVYALGGVGAGDVSEAWGHGAQGVAGIRGLWPEG